MPSPYQCERFHPTCGSARRKSFSTLQMQLLECNMQRQLCPDSNARLEATYRHSHLSSRLNESRHHGRPCLFDYLGRSLFEQLKSTLAQRKLMIRRFTFLCTMTAYKTTGDLFFKMIHDLVCESFQNFDPIGVSTTECTELVPYLATSLRCQQLLHRV